MGKITNLYLAEFLKNESEYKKQFDEIYYLGYVAIKKGIELGDVRYKMVEYRNDWKENGWLALKMIIRLSEKKRVCLITDKKDAQSILNRLKMNVENYAMKRRMTKDELDFVLCDENRKLFNKITAYFNGIIDVMVDDNGDIVYILDGDDSGYMVNEKCFLKIIMPKLVEIL